MAATSVTPYVDTPTHPAAVPPVDEVIFPPECGPHVQPISAAWLAHYSCNERSRSFGSLGSTEINEIESPITRSNEYGSSTYITNPVMMKLTVVKRGGH